MTLGSKFKDICLSLGKNNNPTYAVMAIATVKGICRPLFTMMDKTEKPETKKYTALREGLTEAIAIPTYWATATLAGKMSKHIKGGESAQAIAKKNLLFIGVCTAALIVIPAVCSAVIKPFMKFIQNKNGQEKQSEECPKFDTGSTNELQNPVKDFIKQAPATVYPVIITPTMTNFATPKIQPTMKVGAV